VLVVVVEGQDRLVPFVSAIVPTVDVAAGLVVVDPPEGLFDL
jgi:16S rRNA processing protein RimM